MDGMNPSCSRRRFLGAASALGAMATLGPIAGLASRALGAQQPSAQTILRNARIATMNPRQPEAQAVAIAGGRFVAVGTNHEIGALATPSTKIIDARNRRVIPGLTDTHTHTIRGGLNYALELRWDGIMSRREAMQSLREQVRRTPPGQWVRVVGGFSPHQFLDDPRLPTLDEINQIAPETPVFILHVYSAAILNKAALRALGMDSKFPDNRYPGGTIQRDAGGNPTGLLLATPSALILYSTLHDGPRLTTEQQLVSSRHFMRELNRLGVTSTLDCGGGFQQYPDDYGVIRELHQRRALTMRIGFSTFIQRPGKELEDFTTWTNTYQPGEGDDFFRLLGGGEMLVRSIYDFEVWGSPQVIPPAHAEADLEPVLRLLAQKRWPFRFHATYSETVGRHLDVIERVARDFSVNDLHWIVDHAESLSQENMERIARLGGGIAIQNRIAFQEREFLDRYGPQAAAEAPPIKKMMAMGIPVGAGTDMSRVSSYNPWLCLEWLITGKGVGGHQLLGESTKLDRTTALRLWTDNAWFSNEQDKKGRIEPGLLADLAVLSADVLDDRAVPDEQIRSVESVLTLVGGQSVHAAGDFAAEQPTLPQLTPDWSPVLHSGTFGAQRSAT